MSSSPWRRAVKRVLRGFGYDVIQYRPSSSDAAKLTALMRHAGVDLVLDVGANEGQFAQELRDGGYRGRIVSFEPLREAHARLQRAAAGHAGWTVHERCAIGDRRTPRARAACTSRSTRRASRAPCCAARRGCCSARRWCSWS